MPKKLHDKLVKEAKKKGLVGEEADRYIYGTLAKYEKSQKNKKKRENGRKKSKR